MVGQQRKLDFYFSRRQNKERVNYLKMNQGYDEEDAQHEDSNFTGHGSPLKRSKKIRKVRPGKINTKEKQYVKDDLEILLSWKRGMKLKPYDDDSSHVHAVKNVCTCDLSKFGTNIQGIFINVRWENDQTKDGVSIDDFAKLQLPKKLINNGIVFIWSDKSLLCRIIEAMEEKGFNYIENFVTVNLSLQVAYEELKKIKPFVSNAANKQDAVLNNLAVLQDRLQVKDILDKRNYKYLSNSKRTLLMFRKFDKTQLELRHQRTSDVLFDLVDDDCSLSPQTREYVYQLIETLLPKASDHKLMELWGEAVQPRKGWVTVAEAKKK